jgi:ribosome biogenesis GTPase
MNLRDLGWDDRWQQELAALADDAQPGRVMVAHRLDYEVVGPEGRLRAQRKPGLSGAQLPTVGDWVALRAGQIVAILPRRSVFVRKAPREHAGVQMVAANIDVVFIVTSANDDFNPRRIERYLAAVHESGAMPVLELNKVDLCASTQAFLSQLGAAADGLPIACISVHEQRGKEALTAHLTRGKTAALVGMSGVGKSSIVNWLLGDEALATGAVRGDDRGLHTTTHRELFTLPGGGIVIDTPGMRELGLAMDPANLAGAFADIERVAQRCRFADCGHVSEPGCAVRAALEGGTLDADRFAHYRQLHAELTGDPKATRRGKRGPRRR